MADIRIPAPRFLDRLADMLRWWEWHERFPRPPRKPSSPVYGGGSAYECISFILRTDLTTGAAAIIEKTTFRSPPGVFCTAGSGSGSGTGTGTGSGSGPQTPWKWVCWDHPKRRFSWMIDRLGEFTGAKNLHCGMAHRLADTPTPEELCLKNTPEEIEGFEEWWPGEEEAIWDTRLWEAQRVVCANFTDCGCQTGDPCDMGGVLPQ